MGISKLNKGSVFSVNTEGFDFINLGDLELDKEYVLKGVYVLKKRGKMKQDMPNAIIEGKVVNLPAHLLDDVNIILGDAELVKDIEDGKCGFSVYTYSDDNGEHRSIRWIDFE